MKPFSAYQQYCQQLIKTRRLDYATASPAAQHLLLQANSPFEWAPTASARQAVILIHGLFDSPCIMQSLTAIFQQQDYLVRVLLLPGHGTRPDDLITIQFEQWLDICRLAIDSLPPTIERVILCGFSTGALLSHYLALSQHSAKIAGLVSFSPALALHPIERTLLNSPRLIKLISRLSPWYGHSAIPDYAKYTRYAINGAYQVQRLIQQCPLKAMSIPSFYALTANDKVIDSQRAWRHFHDYNQHPQSRCFIYSAKALNLPDDQRFIVRNSCFPDQAIANFSHVALAVAPDHPHYGIMGDYSLQLKPPANKPLVLGEYGGNTTQRLSYNPDFAYMSTALKDFLANI